MTVDRLPEFTAHNVRLDDGTQTFPAIGYTMDQNPVALCVKRLVNALYPHGLQGKTIIDVGCLEGGFATEFARMGMIATGVEVRESNYKNCLFVQDRVDLPNLNFIQGDAVDIAKFGQFDIFFVSGLLYHLDKPRDFLEDVARNCKKALILWTHITHAEESEGSKAYSLSPLCENEALHGRWYPEHGDIPRDDLDQLKWASWDNKKSFWVQKEYLLQLLKDIGFDLVFEQFDCMDDIVGDMTDGFYNRIDRVMLVAIKSGSPAMEQTAPSKQRTLGTARRPPAPIARSLSAELAVAEQRANASERTLSEVQAMLRGVYASTSWRITTPIRRLGMLLRRETPRA
jgi:SAM-dependent methyltransferase